MALDLILPHLVDLVKVPINRYVVMPITQSISYAFKCERRVQTLQDEVNQLKNKKDRLQHSVDDAARNAQEIYPNVTEWLRNADIAIREAEELVQRREEAEKKCFVGLCPNFKTRYQLSKNAELKTTEIQKHRNKEGLDQISFRPQLQQIPQQLASGSGKTLSSRVSKLNQIMEALRDVNLNMIGVYGMGGIGKTTLAYQVQSKALQENLFENVIVIPVSQTPELRRIQGVIADFLGLKFDAEEIPGRASQLHKSLEKSRVLIILDNVWKRLDLFAVGIPSKVCKIMLTSRKMDLLSKEMGAQKLFPLEALEEAETLSLFMSVAEPNDDLHAIATEVAKKCAGLPLLIQIVAAALKNKNLHVWKDTLNNLSTFGDEEIYEKVYKVLESSYENLPGKEIKSFFLLCALFGQSNIRIQYLLTCSMGLDLFKHIRTIEGARDRIFSLIDKLKDSSLLLDGDMVGFVKMHDVVRDTARIIASRDQHAFFGTGDFSSMDWPNKDCTRISLPLGAVSELPDMDCPKAELLLLFTEDISLKIPDSFFDGNNKLKVVDCTGIRMMSLPSSIGFLKSLKTLCLHKCRLDNVAVVGELKRLELLSFAGSNIVELPREIEALSRLKLLDMRDCSNLQVIPASVLSKLLSLEELYVLNSFVRWGAKGNASLMELESLTHMSTLEIQIPDLKMIPIGFKCFSRLRRYKISIGHVWDWNGQYERSKTLKLKVEAGVQLDDCTEFLLMETEDLFLDGVGDIESTFSEGFPKLKHMDLANDFEIQHLIKLSMEASFPVLESLHLNKLCGMEKFCSGQLRMGSFGELRILKISKCDKLKSLLSFSSAKCLQLLRELEVAECESMDAVVGGGSDDDHENNEVIELTQLSSLKLSYLPNLIGFCKSKEGTEMGLLFNTMVSFPNLLSLEVYRCDSLKQIFTASMVKCLMQLKRVMIRKCKLVEEIIPSKKMADVEETIVFPELNSLSLYELRNLKMFSSWYSFEFPLLRKLIIEGCYTMRNFVGRDSSTESEEYLFNEKVTFSNMETLQIMGINSIKYLWDEHSIADDSFFQLKFLDVCECLNLLVVFPSKICTRFKRVETLSLYLCNRVELTVTKFPELTTLELVGLEEMKILYEGPRTSCSPKLRRLKIQGCSNISIEKFNLYCEELIIDDQSFQAIHQSTDFSVELCTKLKKVTLNSFDEDTIAIVFRFLSGIKSLEMLSFDECSLEVLFKLEDTISQRPTGAEQHHRLRLKHLELQLIKNLKHIIKKDSQLLQHLQILKIKSCGDLMTIAPSSTCLQSVTTLHLQHCNNVTYLITTSTAKTMVHLIDLKVEECESIEEIVAKDADDEEHDEIIFNKLQFLELTSLPYLNSFCSNKYNFSFQLLEQVIIKQCPRMNIFCDGVIRTPKLRGILFEDEQQWEGNLNDTISSQLRTWVGEHFEEGRLFRNLESLELMNNTFSSKALLANQMQLLNKLGYIIVRDCDSIQVVFDLESDVGLLLPNLKYLDLFNLPMLTQLCNKAPKGILDFNKLKMIRIDNCSRLVYAFTWSMASCLSQLERIEVENCEMMQMLIEDEEDAATKAILDKLGNVVLKNMPKFSSIYSGRDDLECPSLNKITIRECPIMRVFFSTQRVFPRLKELSIDMKSIKGMMQFEEPTIFFSNLKYLEVLHCSDTPRSRIFLARFLSRLPSLDELMFCDSSYKELFNSNLEEVLTVPRIKSLTLNNLENLNKIWWHVSLFLNLETLEVDECNQLMNLITPSMARNMVQLKVLRVSNCNMLMEIVGDGSNQMTDEIVFTNLKTLELFGLQNLEAFSLTRYNFQFPCLDQVFLRRCPKLRIFCHGITNTPMLTCVKELEYTRNSYWEGDLNTTTIQLYQKTLRLVN